MCCGSFVNMLVYRTAVQYELESRKFKVKNKNRSFCDYCGRQLKWYENIPVISWLVQKGKTRCCSKKLSVLYSIVELVTGVLFLMVWNLNLKDSSTLFEMKSLIILIIELLIVVFLVFSAVFDLKYMILPDFSTIILIAGALVIWIIDYFGEWSYLWSALISFGFLWLLFLIKIRGQEAMGFGDAKLAIFMGLFLGRNVIIAFYIAFISGALVALWLIFFKKANRKSLVSFGPFLILGFLVNWFWGNQLADILVFQFIR